MPLGWRAAGRHDTGPTANDKPKAGFVVKAWRVLVSLVGHAFQSLFREAGSGSVCKFGLNTTKRRSCIVPALEFVVAKSHLEQCIRHLP
jgi:hypothetical protein